MDSIRTGIDTTALRTTLARVAPDLEKELRKPFKDAARAAKEIAVQNAPSRTGRLKASITSRTKFNAKQTRSMVMSNQRSVWPAEYGRHAEYPYTGKFFARKAAQQTFPKSKEAIDRTVERICDEFNK